MDNQQHKVEQPNYSRVFHTVYIVTWICSLDIAYLLKLMVDARVAVVFCF
ncbi:hypothetical protein [Chitinophaga sp. 212800010-3]|nr:hypothetical protein [Chitinophaga sp. 212800010-3]